MRRRSKFGLYILLPAAIGILGLGLAVTLAQSGGAPGAAPQAPPTSPQVVRTEANLVLVDVVATNKKGEYINDLDVKEFQVLEDNQPQTITAFQRPEGTQGPRKPGQPHYIVVFFDDSSMTTQDQMLARRAANQFVEKTASPDRLMAVVDFTGTTQIVQNFTSDGAKLRAATEKVQYSAVA